MTSTTSTPQIPDDDLTRDAVIARSDDDHGLAHWGVVGDTYTVLLSGEDTGGRYTLIDMFVPPGGGPPPHRHDFEEMFSVLEGEIEVTFRGEKSTLRAGETINIPANAPHVFTNAAEQPARMLCMCSPAGQERFFAEIGAAVSSRTETPPELEGAAQKAFMEKAVALAPAYRTELLI